MTKAQPKKPSWLSEAKAKVQKLGKLQPNWNSYGALVPTPEAIKGAILLLHFVDELELPMPQIVPTAVGGIQLEWHDDFEFEVECQGHGIYVLPITQRVEISDFAKAVVKKCFRLYLAGSNPEEYLLDLVSQVRFIWQEYAMAFDDELSEGGQRFKRYLLEIVT